MAAFRLFSERLVAVAQACFGRYPLRPRLRESPEHVEKYLRDRTALGRFGTDDEVNDIVVFLASDRASFFHGAILQVDGGQSRHYMPQTFMD